MHTIKWGALYGVATALLLALAACSTAPPTNTAKSRPLPAPAGAAVAINQHPLAKYIEIDGFRITESGPGKMKITFAVINHSEADIGDLGLKMQLVTSADKPGDAPIAEFEATVPSLGPLENKEVSVVVPTTMRVYELPDWQFLRGRFEITSPAP
jgi:hypothetical protein